jgi:hypothetical protein
MSLGSWLRDHPRTLEGAYKVTHSLFNGLGLLFARLGYKPVEACLHWPEERLKGLVFEYRSQRLNDPRRYTFTAMRSIGCRPL